MKWKTVRTVARADLLQLAQAKDFWVPMLILGSIFFFFAPTILLLAITSIGDVDVIQKVSQAVDVLPHRTFDPQGLQGLRSRGYAERSQSRAEPV